MVSPKLFQMSNNEFVSALCRRNTFEDPMVPKRAPITSREDSSLFSCGCDGAARSKPIDPFGYHLVGCRTGANAIRLHDEVVSMLARLFRCLRVDAIVEPIRIFADLDGGGNSAFKSDKLMDALFQEGQPAPQTPQTLFDADFEGLASNAEVYIFNQDDSQE